MADDAHAPPLIRAFAVIVPELIYEASDGSQLVTVRLTVTFEPDRVAVYFNE